MGLCEFCGEQAGFMRRSHPACKEQFDQGVHRIATIVADSRLSAESGVRRIRELARHHQVKDARLKQVLEEAWADCVTADLQEGGFSLAEETRLDAVLDALGLPDIKAERHRTWNQVLKHRRGAAAARIEELVQEGMARAAADVSYPGRTLADVEADIRAQAAAARIETPALKSLVARCMEGEMERMAEDGHLSHAEERAIQTLCSMCGIKAGDPAQNSIWDKVNQLATLRDLRAGVLPTRFAHVQVPFRMMKSETLIWLFDNVEYRTLKTRREFRGGSTGISVRVARGVYLRQSAFKGRPVEVEEYVHVDTGLLGITTKHVYFTGPARSFRIRHSKMVSLTPFANGIGITRDTVRARPEIFRVEDGWFVYNLLQNTDVA